ncbi:glycosyltransferase family 2 protein [Mesorhizobium xinjiangense]|uniref:glycosyltransferase family 2 protein n=1 Tax=Mesorhizobium xinjiangense TaxID=2678685 RepID=UPI0012ED2DCA|nr:glycosyltransferase family 2 protein [Mesorhizobium xinjiangense]
MASVDVVIPCYNYGRYLGECVASVLCQEGVDLRVLIIDNASKDDSLAIAQSLAARDARIEVIAHAKNMGATFSYNEGIDWAASDYLLILDADDMLAPGALARATTVLDENPRVSFTHGIEARLEGNAGEFRLPPDPPGPTVVLRSGMDHVRDLCRTPVNSIGANTVVRRTAVQKKIGHYRAALPYTDDLEMWLRLATAGDVACIRTVQAVRRYHNDRHSVSYQAVQLRDFRERERAFESFFDHEGAAIAEAHALLAQARHGLGEHAYWSALSHLARGHGRIGLGLLRLSHHWRPWAALLPPVQWLLRMDRPFDRGWTILGDALRLRRRPAHRSDEPSEGRRNQWAA